VVAYYVTCTELGNATFSIFSLFSTFGNWGVNVHPVRLVDTLVHGQVTIIFVVSVGLSVCLFVCAEFFSAVFDSISIKLGLCYMSGSSCVP